MPHVPSHTLASFTALLQQLWDVDMEKRPETWDVLASLEAIFKELCPNYRPPDQTPTRHKKSVFSRIAGGVGAISFPSLARNSRLAQVFSRRSYPRKTKLTSAASASQTDPPPLRVPAQSQAEGGGHHYSCLVTMCVVCCFCCLPACKFVCFAKVS